MKSTKDASLQRNFRLFYASEFFANTTFFLPIYIIFGHEYLGVTYFQAGALFAVLFSVVVAFDFVSGVIADRWGRQRTFAVGMVLQILAIMPFILTKAYPVLLMAVVVWGIGNALYSNSLEAQIYDESKQLGAIDQYQRANANRQISAFAGRVGASIVGGLTYKIHPTLPFTLTAVALSLALISGLSMKFHTVIDKAKVVGRKEHIRQSLKAISQSRALYKFIIVGLIVCFTGDLLFSYYQPYFVSLDISTAVLGMLYAGISIASMGGAYLMRTLPNKFSAHAIERICLGAVFVNGAILYSLRLPFVLIAPLIMGMFSSGLLDPISRLYANKYAVSHLRASILSLVTTVFSIGSASAFFVSAYLADQLTPQEVIAIALVVTALGFGISLGWRTTESSGE